MDLASLTPLPGGWSGQTFVAETAGERVVVRLYPPGLRPEAAPEIDADLLALVRGLLPVPDVVEVRRGDATADVPGLLITSWVEGERGDLLLPRLDEAGLHRMGSALGAVAAALAGMPVLRAGGFGEGLAVVSWDSPEDLPTWVETRLRADPSWAGLLEGLLVVADEAQRRLETVTRHCVVHSDLNPKNVLLDPTTGAVTAVLDWEFAHAGHPATDLGNLLRFERAAPYVEGVLDAWCSRHPLGRDDAVLLGRSADLWALVDLASRRAQNPVADRADALLREIARTRDVSAMPSATQR